MRPPVTEPSTLLCPMRPPVLLLPVTEAFIVFISDDSDISALLTPISPPVFVVPDISPLFVSVEPVTFSPLLTPMRPRCSRRRRLLLCSSAWNSLCFLHSYEQPAGLVDCAALRTASVDISAVADVGVFNFAGICVEYSSRAAVYRRDIAEFETTSLSSIPTRTLSALFSPAMPPTFESLSILPVLTSSPSNLPPVSFSPVMPPT